MKFFIPTVGDPEKAEELYQATKKLAADTKGWSIVARRIRRITFWDRGKIVEAAVGGREPCESELVIAILESENYLICTPNRGVLKGDPLMVGKRDVIDSEDFEP
jgi:hypothetical protein